MVDKYRDIERSSALDQTTGEIKYTYFVSGTECATKYLDSKIADKYIGYDLILSDLECAEKWINLAYKIIDGSGAQKSRPSGVADMFLPSHPDGEHEILQALFIASVAYYGKCFTQAKGRKIKLEAENIDSKYRAKHNQIMEFQNTIAAHSGEGPWDAGKLARIVHPATSEIIVWSELKMLQFFDDRDDQYSYVNLINLVKEMAKGKLPEIRTAILQNET